jgi:hypothetical protein
MDGTRSTQRRNKKLTSLTSIEETALNTGVVTKILLKRILGK